MTTGFTQRFKGKVVAAELSLTQGGLVDAKSGIAGNMDYVYKLPMTVTAVANTDFTMSLPPGMAILSASVYTTTAFTASTDAKIQLGSAAGGAQYVASVSIAAIGFYALTLVAAAAGSLLSFPSGSPNMFVRIVQSGTASAVGAATLVINAA